MEPDELLPQQRAGVIILRLAQGAGLTTREVALLTGVTPRRARELLAALSQALPIYRSDAGVWEICRRDEEWAAVALPGGVVWWVRL